MLSAPRRFRFLPALVAAVLLAAPLAADDLPPPAEAKAVLQQTLASQNAQTEMPGVREREYIMVRNTANAGVPAGFAQVLLYIAIAAFLAVVVWTLLENGVGAEEEKKKKRGAALDPTAEVQARMATAQGEADTLAEAGDYAGAMHVLLLRSLDEMRRRLGISIASSLTSREIVRRVGLGEQARSALRDIVGRVEISYFGSHRPGAEEYAACRASYAALAGSLRGEGGA